MKKLFNLIFFLVCFVSTVAAQQPASFWMGQMPPFSGSGSGRETSANKHLAFGFLATESKTITSLRFCVYYKVDPGSLLGSTDAEVKVYGSTIAGLPDTGSGAIATVTFDPTTTGCKNTTSMSYATTPGEQLWFVVRNTYAVPATNYFAINIAPEGLVGIGGGGYSHNHYGKGTSYQESSDGGITWTNVQRSAASPYRVNYGDSTYYGYPFTEFDVANNPVNSGDRVYGDDEVGNKFTTPADTSLNLRCVSFMQAKIGSPTGSLRFRLYTGTTLTATTSSMTESGSGSNSSVTLCFSSVQVLAANTTYRVVMAETTQSDASGNAYGPSRIDWDSDSNSLALKPFNGTMSKTVCTGSCNGGTWTDTTTSFYVMQLLLQFGDEFPTSGGGSGGLKNQNKVNGGVQ